MIIYLNDLYDCAINNDSDIVCGFIFYNGLKCYC